MGKLAFLNVHQRIENRLNDNSSVHSITDFQNQCSQRRMGGKERSCIILAMTSELIIQISIGLEGWERKN